MRRACGIAAESRPGSLRWWQRLARVQALIGGVARPPERQLGQGGRRQEVARAFRLGLAGHDRGPRLGRGDQLRGGRARDEVQKRPRTAARSPAYSACIARKKADQSSRALEGAAQLGFAQLKEGCRKRYEELLSDSVSGVIHDHWLIGEAGELGLRVSPALIQRELRRGRKSFKTEAEFQTRLKNQGETLADAKALLRLNALGEGIFKVIEGKQHPATSAEVRAYYNAHRKKYAIPEGRDVRILRTTTRAGALSAMRELRAGKSFAQVVNRQLSQIGQPIGAVNGEVKDLLPGVYEEKPLNDAIFSAKPNRLYGPFELKAAHKTIAPETNSGFFVYQVRKRVPGGQTPLGQVRNSIAEAMTTARKNKTLSGFIRAFRAKWTARTDCAPGYVVLNCKQYNGPEARALDPYRL